MLLTLTEHWKEELDKHKVIGAVAMDLSKAFDCLPHDLILEKLKFYGLNDKAVALLRSYLSSRYQRVNYLETRFQAGWACLPEYLKVVSWPGTDTIQHLHE